MQITCGLDVHKDSVFCCILCENGEKKEKKFGVLSPELDELRSFIIENGVVETAMESTSIYWIPVWNALDGACKLLLVNPYFIKQLPGRKSDVRDAAWIAECVMKNLIRGSFVPEATIQKMRQYNRRSFDLTHEITHKLTKLDSILQKCNIRLSNYVSTLDSKSYRDVVRMLSEGETNPKKLIDCVHTRTINRHGRKVLIAALTGIVTDVDIDMIRQLKEELEIALKHKEECQEKLSAICMEHFSDDFERLQTIPGVKRLSAASILAEIGADMRQFPTPGALVAWCGLAPRNEESAGKIKRRNITHGNRYARKTMIECAWGASRKQDCFFYRFNHNQVMVRHKNTMKVRVAVARKMLCVMWHLLAEKTVYIDYSMQS